MQESKDPLSFLVSGLWDKPGRITGDLSGNLNMGLLGLQPITEECGFCRGQLEVSARPNGLGETKLYPQVKTT